MPEASQGVVALAIDGLYESAVAVALMGKERKRANSGDDPARGNGQDEAAR
jgi:hypothetical protein